MTELLAPQSDGIPLPMPTAVSQPYWDAARDGKLIYQRCGGCHAIPSLPAVFCGACGSHDLAWERSSGQGTLYSWTVVWRPQHPAFHVPYAPAIMAVQEGWWLLTSVVGCRPEDLTEGMALEAVFHHAGSGIWLPYAQPHTGRSNDR